eukprot:gene7336-10000_t
MMLPIRKKDFSFGAKRKANKSVNRPLIGGKRRTDFVSLHNYKNEVNGDKSVKDFNQLLKEKEFQDPSSKFYKFEKIYDALLIRKGGSTNATTNNVTQVVYPSPSTTTNAENIHGNNQKNKLDRRLIIVMNKENVHDLSLIRLFVKDNELEKKHTIDMRSIQGVDIGIDENELLLTVNSIDYDFNFKTQIDRDEALWVIINICKSLKANDLFSVGYSVDMDALGYMTSTNGTLQNFPKLSKIINIQSLQFGDLFSDEEAEAENLLNELDWGTRGGSRDDLQLILSNQSDNLNKEIIDFLLQWEENDTSDSSETNKQKQPSGTGNDLLTQKSRATASKVNSVRDTRQVLDALRHVDRELDGVDQWLFQQINKLSAIQKNLSMIETESGALETSWRNLNSVQEVIAILVKSYSLLPMQEELISHPEKVLNPILKSTTLNSIEHDISALVNAVQDLRNALFLKSTDLPSIISPTQWKHLHTIVAISTQKSHLAELADSFCNGYSDFSTTVFDWILKHKSLTDTNNSLKGNQSVIVKQFLFNTIIETFVIPTPELSTIKTINKNTSKYVFNESQRSSKFVSKSNQFLSAVVAYDTILLKLVKLQNLFLELIPNYSHVVQDSYVKASRDRLYHPLLKLFFKDLSNIITSKQPIVHLSNSNRFKIGGKVELPMKLNHTSIQINQISSWMALRVTLIELSPVLSLEESFLKTIFSLESVPVDLDMKKDRVGFVPNLTAKTNGFMKTKLFNMMEALFTSLMPRLETCLFSTQSSSDVDGMEAIAMLTVLTRFAQSYNNEIDFSNSSNTNPALTTAISTRSSNENIDNSFGYDEEKIQIITYYSSETSILGGTDSIDSLLELNSVSYLNKFFECLKNILLYRINAYVTEQLNWISNQQGDPKSPNVSNPFARFPTFILQVLEMTKGLNFECIDQLIIRITKELFSWLNSLALSSDKYQDKIKLINFTFFINTIKNRNINILDSFISAAIAQQKESTNKYVNWMVSYEMPALSQLAVRMDGIGSKVNEEELSLYIRRKDVIGVVKELDMKTLENSIINMKKRLDKHFKSDFDTELHLVSDTWIRIKERVVGILTRLEEAALVSYQIKLEIGPSIVQQLFQKHSA